MIDVLEERAVDPLVDMTGDAVGVDVEDRHAGIAVACKHAAGERDDEAGQLVGKLEERTKGAGYHGCVRVCMDSHGRPMH